MDNAKIGVLFLIAALVAVIIIVLITTIVVTGIIQWNSFSQKKDTQFWLQISIYQKMKLSQFQPKKSLQLRKGKLFRVCNIFVQMT